MAGASSGDSIAVRTLLREQTSADATRFSVPAERRSSLSPLLELAAGLGAPRVGRESSAADVLAAASGAETLHAWAAIRLPPGMRISRADLQTRLGEDVAAIDAALGRQVDAILHAPKFQAIESSWRGLQWLVGQALQANDDGDGPARVEVRVLSVTKRELARDQGSAVEFDRSQLWRKVYEEEFGTAGGTPFGLLVTDHEFSHHPDDVSLLAGLSEVAMAAFAPLLASPKAELLGLDSLTQLEMLPPLEVSQRSPDYVKWQALRERDESRFIGMPLPRVLGRRPYDGWINRPEAEATFESSWERRGFRYHEQVDRADGSGRLWMSAVWPMAGVVIREFGRSGWFADIRGGSRGLAIGGVVDGLPVDQFVGLDGGSVVRGPTEVFVTDEVHEELDWAGFVPLRSTGPDGRAVFHSNASLHRAKRYDSPVATANARISSMLQYVLCVSRIAHYLKLIARDKLGSFTEAPEFQRFLSDWVNQYVTPDDQASAETRAKMPLRAAQVEVRDEPGTAGAYRVVMRLQPHFQLDRLDATLRLVSTVRRAETR
jgi:type VI secretion system ImpC/EvpB family protein